jgi:O-antigen/teichoic acid export membrane protein
MMGDPPDGAAPSTRTRRRLSTSIFSVAGSQLALAGSNYVVLAIAARNLDAAGFAALSSYYLLINTVGRGLFAAVEMEATRAVADADARGHDDGPARTAAVRHTLFLLGGALVLLVASAPLLADALGTVVDALFLLGIGAVAMAASYVIRGPLAGHRRYGLYALTFWIEALAGLGTAIVLAATATDQTRAWTLILALAPLLAFLIVGPLAARARRHDRPDAADGVTAARAAARGGVYWSAALLLASQGVWNLAPVIVTSRLTEASVAAAGFVTVAVLLRAPVLLFPSVQALLLPAFTTMVGTGDDTAVRRTTRSLTRLLLAGGVVWVVVGITVVPPLARLVFGAAATPPAWVVGVLAASTVIGAAAQIGQTHLVAVRRPDLAAIAWIAGVVVLVSVGLVAAPPLTAATVGQAAAAVTVLVLLSLMRRRQQAQQ